MDAVGEPVEKISEIGNRCRWLGTPVGPRTSRSLALGRGGDRQSLTKINRTSSKINTAEAPNAGMQLSDSAAAAWAVSAAATVRPNLLLDDAKIPLFYLVVKIYAHWNSRTFVC